MSSPSRVLSNLKQFFPLTNISAFFDQWKWATLFNAEQLFYVWQSKCFFGIVIVHECYIAKEIWFVSMCEKKLYQCVCVWTWVIGLHMHISTRYLIFFSNLKQNFPLTNISAFLNQWKWSTLFNAEHLFYVWQPTRFLN